MTQTGFLPAPSFRATPALPAFGDPPTPAFDMRVVKATAISDDGLCLIEFDARTWMESASEEDLQLLLKEWLVGDGPGCRRVMERHSKDTQAFLAYALQQRQNWGLRIEPGPFKAWIQARRPFLSDCIDPAMIAG